MSCRTGCASKINYISHEYRMLILHSRDVEVLYVLLVSSAGAKQAVCSGTGIYAKANM